MEEAVEGGRGRWSTAVALTVAVLALSIFDALAIVLLPLALLLLALPAERRIRWAVVGILLWMAALVLSGGPLALLSRGWGLTLGALYLVMTLVRPDWPVLSRALTAVACTLGIGLLALLGTGQLAELEGLVREHLATVSATTLSDLQARVPDAEWLAEFRTATEQIAQLQAEMFPALLALQSIAALALASWWVRRLGRSRSNTFDLAPLREFRFNDQLIWVLIAALVLLVLPLDSVADRLALNALVFMATLYALRGLAVFVYLAAGTRSVATMVLGALAFVVLYPVALTAALLMGVGDTWLDVRRRAEAAHPT